MRTNDAALLISGHAEFSTRWASKIVTTCSAANLAHGEQRQLEVAMALATQPRLLLLDEPMAGMGIEESQRMIALLATLKRRQTIILVEHDMDAVFRARRPHLGAGLRPRHRHRHAGARSAPTRKCAGPTSGEDL